MIFLPKCRAFNVVLEKGHGTEKKGMALEKRAWRDAMLKLAQGNIFIIVPYFTLWMLDFFLNTIRVSNSLDPDQASFVGPDLGQNCLQRLLVDNKCRLSLAKS